ncbi:GNAT family N-acetyltransferase [Bacillus sp. 1P06AnD]|uniref:GNAT family N-acetyltransferase n=1 Tax=Bacillus sp. 1P06AnD TaxID=3132208 RepID=UPI0039A06C2E
MGIVITQSTNAKLVHDLMNQAFMEYKDEVPPSSALEETVESITIALEGNEQALICYLNNKPIGMVRFQVKNNHVYFSRLSVLPEKQGIGIAKALLKALEEYATKKELTKIQ